MYNATVEIVHQAYNTGLLQQHSLTVMGITVTMESKSKFQRLTAKNGKRVNSTTIDDTDSEAVVHTSIALLLIDLL